MTEHYDTSREGLKTAYGNVCEDSPRQRVVSVGDTPPFCSMTNL